MGIDPRLVSIWTDDDLRREIARQNRNAEYHTKRAAELLQDVREIAAQLSMRHPRARSRPRLKER